MNRPILNIRQLIIFIFLISISSYASGMNKTGQQTSDTVPQQTMPILAWYSIPEAFSTTERFGELAETGINLHFSFYSNANEVQKALDLAGNSLLKVIISCPELETETEKTVRRFMYHPALAGYYLQDEPTASQFGKLREWVKRVRAVDSIHYCYINLFPNDVKPRKLEASGYRSYVNRFLKEVSVWFLSFDHYPVMGETLRPIWYENLEIIAAASRKYNLPFWAFALTTAHDYYPVPDMAELRLQVYSNLAYGAQAIQYFTYWTPPVDAYDFHHGPITLDGKRTNAYDLIKAMNTEIRALSGVFLGATVMSVHHTGTTIPKGTKRLKKLPAPFLKIDTGNSGAVVSYLKNGDKKYLIIVNRSFLKPLDLRIELNSNSVRQVLKNGRVNLLPSGSACFQVEAGDVLILRYN
ncbi:MAG: hypothetical protein H6Q19_1241 [Bacteroidetes bacterium]|nr:hypothetical protein [Bacteroidota bacterium]